MFKTSNLKISPHTLSFNVPKILMNDIEFLFSTWEFYDIDIIMNNCNTSLLSLNVNLCERNFNSTNLTSTVNFYNSTLGHWKFTCINDVRITDCSIIGNPSTYKIIANFTYSTAVLDKITIKELHFDCSQLEICGLIVDKFSKVIIKNSFYELNLNASIWVTIGSSLVIENCTFLDNDVFNGVICGDYSTVHITDSTFANNIGSELGAASMLVHSVLILKNCTFINNQGLNLGGAVNVQHNSILMISNSVFANNTAGMAGGAVYAAGYTW